jgi:hypothetical protein
MTDSHEGDAPQSSRTAADIPLPGGDFSLFLSRLSIQGLLSCGVLENPVTGQKQPSESMAQALIDDLAMLQDKTRGNLEPDKDSHLTKVLGDLREVFRRTFEATEG